MLIPTSEPVLKGNEKKYVLECFKSNWISANGPFTKKLEKKFAKFIGTKYAVCCSNGTSAIHLALIALGIGKGDEVIIPDFTIICSASMTILAGAKPVLVDVDKYWCIDPDKIEEKITPRTKAIMVVHMYGNPANMKKIMKIARKHKLFVIEDACAAHGAEVDGQKIGSIGDIGCFSFYASKNITSGEGGMVVTNKKEIADKVNLLKSHGFERPRFIHRIIGFNYRMTDIQSAIALAQLENIRHKISKRREIASYYIRLLKNRSEVEIHQEPPWGKSVFWMFGVIIKDSFGRTRDEIIELLWKKGIGTERFFLPMSEQPIFRNERDPRYPDIKGSFPVSDALGKQGLYIPSGLNLTKKEQKYIADTLMSLIKK
ncbi:MAG: DegT/DnrJ/EryC1/StrS family aminotransferase [Candidatus Levybacteria bacterium]|nr:DegT/DnrJ/EryC1/StrS family aminotransferase [Candidatus Levybacteria bacterium]